jgi:hypothetical protein
MSAPPPVDNRLNVRVQYGDPVTAQPIGAAAPQHIWSLLAGDISEGGFQLSSPELVAVNTRLLLSSEPEPWVEPIRAVGKVRWVAQTGSPNRWNIGVSFTEVSDAAAQRLRELVASRRGN